MVLKRVIPCLDVDAGRVVKGTNFVGLRDAGDPVELAARYDAEGADELIFLDITATHQKRETIVELARRTAFLAGREVRVPEPYAAQPRRLLTQLAENHHLGAVFGTLFDSRGSEVYLKPASNYVRMGEWVNFATVIEGARQRSAPAIGYRVVADSSEAPAFGVHLNPAKDERFALVPGDCVIVLAEG